MVPNCAPPPLQAVRDNKVTEEEMPAEGREEMPAEESKRNQMMSPGKTL